MSSEPTVFVIDDEDAVRDSIRMLLERRGYKTSVFASADEFLRRLSPSASGCIVSDVRLNGVSGLDLQRKLAESGSTLPIILITGHGDIDMAVLAIKRGAFDFIEKPFDDTRLYQSVAEALAERRQEQARCEAAAAMKMRIAELSDRQREVMMLLVDGLSNKEIAQKLGISHRTVETYRAFVMAKTDAQSLADLVKLAMRAGVTS
ncbi:MAG TPA: response regulator [Hyphomicrobiaceae bacterium]|nr:response regulator [Hyphomicrobiaceae bacterium]